MAARPIRRLAIVGFGEVGGIFAEDFARRGIKVSVFDILFASPRQRQQMLEKVGHCKVRAAENLADCLRSAELVISAVTASSALDVAKEAAPILRARQIFLDLNSVSPGMKRKVAACIEPGRAHFVEAAVMAGVPGPRLNVPMLLGGPHAAEIARRLGSIGMNVTALSDEIGPASAVKMCRSVIMKGLEALVVECLFAARQYGAEDAVLESLAATYPGLGWKDHLPDYLISRVAQHGRRRAAEMREVAEALEAVGIEPTMAVAVAERQERLVDQMQERNVGFEQSRSFRWRSLVDAMFAGTRPGSPRQTRNASRSKGTRNTRRKRNSS
jgi:3-hydroxyisobutyrate dehydrogenase-like beta-hydroxyacid dehydrogenase